MALPPRPPQRPPPRTPTPPPAASGGGGGAEALRTPSTILAIMAGLWGSGLVFMTILDALGIIEGQGVQISAGEGSNSAVNLVVSFFVMAYYFAIAAGAWTMPRGGMRAVAWVTAILASIPCCSPFVCLGMIPGIWCIVLLTKSDVSQSLR